MSDVDEEDLYWLSEKEADELYDRCSVPYTRHGDSGVFGGKKGRRRVHPPPPEDAELVVTEELRNRSGPGRRLVEAEEDVDAVADLVRDTTLGKKTEAPSSQGKRRVSVSTALDTIQEAPPSGAPGSSRDHAQSRVPSASEPQSLIEQQELQQAMFESLQDGSVQGEPQVTFAVAAHQEALLREAQEQRGASKRLASRPKTMDAKRQQHEELLKESPNPYLFSSPHDTDGCARNPNRWVYAIPQPGGPCASDSDTDGKYFRQIARVTFH